MLELKSKSADGSLSQLVKQSRILFNFVKGPSTCEAHSILSIDPKGWIPGFVVNTGGPGNSVKTFQVLKKLAEQHK